MWNKERISGKRELTKIRSSKNTKWEKERNGGKLEENNKLKTLRLTSMNVL